VCVCVGRLIVSNSSHFLELLPFATPLDVRYDEQHQTADGDVGARQVERRIVRLRHVVQPTCVPKNENDDVRTVNRRAFVVISRCPRQFSRFNGKKRQITPPIRRVII